MKSEFKWMVAAAAAALCPASFPAQSASAPGEPGTPYANMNHIAPIGVRTEKYFAVPESAKGPAIDPANGYRVEQLGDGLYMVTDNIYQSLFLVYESGVVLIDAPPTLAKHILPAVRGVTPKPVTHIVYSHSHIDHISGTKGIGGKPAIIAHQETKRLLQEAKDPDRPLPTVTFQDKYVLKAGSQLLELSYHGEGHLPGSIFIHAPKQKVLMVVDIVYPGWMPFRRLAMAKNLPGVFRQVDEILAYDFDKYVGGHVARWGTRADVELQRDFLKDLKAAATTALQTTKLAQEMDPADTTNPWALFDNYIDRVVVQCVNALEPKWKDRLAAYDVFIWDQCYAIEASLQLD
jgi:glyoxylase-like metal-dependent hydrolase (beta-lactamase superfamily II)